MITFLRGTLAHKSELMTGGHALVVEVAGVGYQVLTSASGYHQAPALNEPLLVHTSMIVREDSMQLVGFLTREERDMFEILGTASGVGAKVALALMSELTVSELASAIMSSDHKRLSSAKGVGPKLAQKLAIELKDKLSKWRDEKLSAGAYADEEGGVGVTRTQPIEEAETVLLSLGYDMAEIHQALQALQKRQADDFPSWTSEAILQHVLKWLATHSI